VLEGAVVGKGRSEMSIGEFMAMPAPFGVLHADVIRIAKDHDLPDARLKRRPFSS